MFHQQPKPLPTQQKEWSQGRCQARWHPDQCFQWPRERTSIKAAHTQLGASPRRLLAISLLLHVPFLTSLSATSYQQPDHKKASLAASHSQVLCSMPQSIRKWVCQWKLRNSTEAEHQPLLLSFHKISNPSSNTEDGV